MRRKTRIRGTLLLLLPLLFVGAQPIEAQQQTQMVRRSELFAFVVGQGIGDALNNAMNAYALGKAAREELDELRREIAKCGDSCSTELTTKLHKHETAQATVEAVIEDTAFKNNMPVAWANAVKGLLSIEPHKMTAEQKAWNDMNVMLNIIATYCYTISDQIPESQQRCEKDTPYQIARDIDILLNNMCKEKISKEVGLDVKDTSLQFHEDIQVVRKYNGALGAVSKCFENTSYYYSWMKSAYKSCSREWNDRGRNSSFVMKPKEVALWCIPEPTDEAPNYKLLSSHEVEFNWDWLNPAMWRMDVRPKVHECVYGGGPNTNGTAKFYFWAQEPPAIKFRTSWGGATTKRISDEGVSGEKFAYDFVGDGHYLGLRAVDKCPPDLETSIRLRQRLLEETMPSSYPRRSNAHP